MTYSSLIMTKSRVKAGVCRMTIVKVTSNTTTAQTFFYFADYKDGTVSIVCNETGEIVYHEEVK